MENSEYQDVYRILEYEFGKQSKGMGSILISVQDNGVYCELPLYIYFTSSFLMELFERGLFFTIATDSLRGHYLFHVWRML